MTRRLAAALLVTSLLASMAGADPTSDLRRLFPRERDVFIDRDGLTRIAIPPDVLAACRPDLSDLRVFDRDDREVPYLLDAGPPPGTAVEKVQTQDAQVLDVRREEIRREDGPPVHRETYVLGALALGEAAWDLVFETSARRFVRRLTIGPDVGAPLVAGASIFRLPEVSAEKTRVTLPSPAPERLMVMLEGEEGAYLEPRFRFERASTVASSSSRVVVPLAEISRRTEEGRTLVELARPPGVVPDMLEVEATTEWFNRAVEVWDEVPGQGPTPVARARIFRVQAAAPVEQRGIAVQTLRGDRLRLAIDDGDSPPLEGLAVAAVVRQPALVVSLRGAGDAAAGRLRFGGGRAHAPRYDLAAFLQSGHGELTGTHALAAAHLADPSQASPARLGEARDNPVYDGTPALAFAMRAGAPIDERAWTHRRAIAVSPSPDGLTRLRLTAADLAHARVDLADVRVVDGESRQWPYLLDRNDTETWVRLGVEGPTRRRGMSVYELRPPVSPLVVSALALESDVAFFDRGAIVVGRDGDGTETTLLAGRISRRRDGGGPATLALRPSRVQALELRIEDGSDAPLTFRGARALVREHELYLVAPAGQYAVLIGNDDATAPSYELERVRGVILAVSSGAAEGAALAGNPAYSRRARFAMEGGLERTMPVVVLWLVLIAAVIVLAAVTLRLARRGDPSDGESKPVV